MKKYITKAYKNNPNIVTKRTVEGIENIKKSDKIVYERLLDDYHLIKAVFKSLFGEEDEYAYDTRLCGLQAGGGLIKGSKVFKSWQHHLKEWITSDLTPEDYLDKYYK